MANPQLNLRPDYAEIEFGNMRATADAISNLELKLREETLIRQSQMNEKVPTGRQDRLILMGLYCS